MDGLEVQQESESAGGADWVLIRVVDGCICAGCGSGVASSIDLFLTSDAIGARAAAKVLG